MACACGPRSASSRGHAGVDPQLRDRVVERQQQRLVGPAGIGDPVHPAVADVGVDAEVARPAPHRRRSPPRRSGCRLSCSRSPPRWPRRRPARRRRRWRPPDCRAARVRWAATPPGGRGPPGRRPDWRRRSPRTSRRRHRRSAPPGTRAHGRRRSPSRPRCGGAGCRGRRTRPPRRPVARRSGRVRSAPSCRRSRSSRRAPTTPPQCRQGRRIGRVGSLSVTRTGRDNVIGASASGCEVPNSARVARLTDGREGRRPQASQNRSLGDTSAPQFGTQHGGRRARLPDRWAVGGWSCQGPPSHAVGLVDHGVPLGLVRCRPGQRAVGLLQPVPQRVVVGGIGADLDLGVGSLGSARAPGPARRICPVSSARSTWSSRTPSMLLIAWDNTGRESADSYRCRARSRRASVKLRLVGGTRSRAATAAWMSPRAAWTRAIPKAAGAT